MKKILSIIFIAILLLSLGVVGVAAASGIVQAPVLSSLLGADRPKNLGIRADNQLFNQFLTSNQINNRRLESALFNLPNYLFVQCAFRYHT